MSAFNDITKRIQEDIERNKIEKPITVAGKDLPAGTTPQVQTGVVGTPVSKPGTETVTLDATTFQMMECVSSTPGREKPRYTIVEKGKLAKYGNHFVDSKGDRAHVITREVYTLLLGVLRNTGQQIIKLTEDIQVADEKTELYKLTVDALRKNGIID